MERLVTTAQAAEILGISLQGVHYRIKNKKLKSIKQSGKTFVYISDNQEQKINNSLNKEKKQNPSHFESLLEVKDEQISILKKSIKWMRKQHKDEIIRLEENQKRVIEVFNSEIKLLQSAFHEMKTIYKPQITSFESKKKQDISEFISLSVFTKYLQKQGKTSKEIKLIILKAIHRKDRRFFYDKKNKKIVIKNVDFSDLI